MKSKLPKQYAKILYHLTSELKGADLDKAIKAFINLLVRDQALSRVDLVMEEFNKYTKKQQGIVEIEVLTAREISDSVKKNIKQAFGDKTEAEFKVQNDLLGGVLINTEDLILDGTIKTQLEKIKEKMINSKN